YCSLQLRPSREGNMTDGTTLTANYEYSFDADRLQNDIFQFAGEPNQVPQVRLQANFKCYRILAADKKTFEYLLLVDLTDSAVQPGNLQSDTPMSRGYYTDKVKVRMWFEDTRIVVKSDAPQTTEEGGSTSSSTSLSGGFFGETGTVNASISAGVVTSVPDFELLNKTGRDNPGKSYV